MSDRRFGAMIATATVVMFVLMYLNTYTLDHVWFSQTRMWTALVMGALISAIRGCESWQTGSSRPSFARLRRWSV